MKAKKSYIKNLEYKFAHLFGRQVVTVSYFRNGEYNKYTLSDIPLWVKNSKTLRRFINN